MAILKFRDEKGNIIEIPALKGDKGDNGYTPIKGTDYWTEADKNEIKEYVSHGDIEPESLILKSTDSSKRFKISVNDSGVISAVEI